MFFQWSVRLCSISDTITINSENQKVKNLYTLLYCSNAIRCSQVRPLTWATNKIVIVIYLLEEQNWMLLLHHLQK